MISRHQAARRGESAGVRALRAMMTPERLAGAMRLLGHIFSIPSVQRSMAQRGVDVHQLRQVVHHASHPDTMRAAMEHYGEHAHEIEARSTRVSRERAPTKQVGHGRQQHDGPQHSGSHSERGHQQTTGSHAERSQGSSRAHKRGAAEAGRAALASARASRAERQGAAEQHHGPLQQGKKGGSFYVTQSGKKVYVR